MSIYSDHDCEAMSDQEFSNACARAYAQHHIVQPRQTLSYLTIVPGLWLCYHILVSRQAEHLEGGAHYADCQKMA